MLASLDEALASLIREDVPKQLRDAPLARGYFTPKEDDTLRHWFTRFLSLRYALFEALEDIRKDLSHYPTAAGSPEWPLFVVGYSIACLIALGDRYIVEATQANRVMQRKLNEPDSRFRIPPKQYTSIRRSWVHPRQALQMLKAMRHAEHYRPAMEACKTIPHFERTLKRLPELEKALISKFNLFFKAYWRYRSHSFRRKGASFQQKVVFSLLQTGGIWLAKKTPRKSSRQLPATVRNEILRLLQPGDVVITRHHRALTNLFLPGYWPHAALFLGDRETAERMGVRLSLERRHAWGARLCFLEALKDGVRLRSWETTLSVDACVLVRPLLKGSDLAEALTRAIDHEGKGYNFDFDFFRSDRLVCTEIIYRAFDGLGDIQCPLQTRSGRPTFSAEDLLDLALSDKGFSVLGISGTKNSQGQWVLGQSAKEILCETYHAKQHSP